MFVWSELKEGLIFSSNGAFWTFFFFFFLNFGLNRLFQRFWPIRPIQARVGPIQRESTRVGATSPQVGVSQLKKKKTKATWHDAVGRGQRHPSRVVASCRVERRCGTSGAASMLHNLWCLNFVPNKKLVTKVVENLSIVPYYKIIIFASTLIIP